MLLSEMLGVERDTDFGVKGYESTFKLTLNGDGAECLLVKWSFGIEWRLAQQETLCAVILRSPANIIHFHKPLTDEQKNQLRAIWTLGGRWIGKGDLRYGVYAFTERPIKSACAWCSEGSSYNVLHSNSVCDLVSWSDPEPLDIAKALEINR